MASTAKTRFEISLDPENQVEAEILSILESLRAENGKRSQSEVIKEILMVYSPAASIELSLKNRQQRAIASIPSVTVSTPIISVSSPTLTGNHREPSGELTPITGF